MDAPAGPPSIVDTILDRVSDRIFPEAEDRLSINIIKPSDVKTTEKLPVLVFIYGGGSTTGLSNNPIWRGSEIVLNSIQKKKPVLFVTLNYRVNAFGFLASEEVQAAGVANLGLHDHN
ncbi:hypothetical protein FRB94_013787 [Tulasnella sp. JGI-2019a]|nr:hypothetical protein FRB94_013787 [Tulasnella sp. JGI-2019a]KAG9010167.1 hypothetical protein FRB93_004829 [Tulasnella sp. JGI-2019a]KAG9035307.1 hypothetical protein FRB95_011602 [Tulasnella sp. JGI-2019a]